MNKWIPIERVQWSVRDGKLNWPKNLFPSFHCISLSKNAFLIKIFLLPRISGVGLVLRKMGNSINATCYLVKNGDEFEYHTDSTFKSTVVKFKLGVEAEQETLDGRKVLTTYTLDGNTLKQTEKGDKKSELVRVFSDTEMVATCVYGDVTCKRVYKVVS